MINRGPLIFQIKHGYQRSDIVRKSQYRSRVAETPFFFLSFAHRSVKIITTNILTLPPPPSPSFFVRELLLFSML